MKASYRIKVEFTVVDNIESVDEIIDPHKLAQFICDELTSDKRVVAYNILKAKIEVKWYGKDY